MSIIFITFLIQILIFLKDYSLFLHNLSFQGSNGLSFAAVGGYGSAKTPYNKTRFV